MFKKHTSTNNISIGQVMKYFWKINMSKKRFFILCLLGVGIASVSILAQPIYFARMIDVILAFAGWSKIATVHQLVSLLIIILILNILWIVGWRTFGLSIIPMETGNQKKILLQCFQYLHRHSYRFFSNNFSGALVKKVNKLVGAYETITDIFLIDIWRLLIFLPFILITVFVNSVLLGCIFLAFVVVFGLIQYFLYKWNIYYEILANEHDSKITGELADTISNNFNILTFASLSREIHKFTGTLNIRSKIQRKKRYRGEVIHLINAVLLVIFEIWAIYAAVYLRWMSAISVGTIVLVQTYALRLFDQMSSLDQVFKRINRSVGESAEMLEIFDTPHEIIDHTQNILKVTDARIDFQQVDFHYVEGKPVFTNLDLKIKPGEKVAIVGESWWGKTTIVKLLFRFFDIQWGKILIDGQDISQVTQDSLRNNIAMVPQDPILFHRTLRENISYGKPDATEEEIIAASKMARCHEFILNFKEGYDTLVGERWIKLSWGERKRVAIARAILENTSILVMDEATSSLDSKSEQLIQEAMDEVLRNKTAIVIAHRLSTVMKMDKIIVMDKWQIIEHGSHKELLAKENGVYKKLRDIQSGWFIVETQ